MSLDGQSCDQIEVTCEITCADRDGSHETVVTTLYNVTREEEVKLEALPLREQASIEQNAQDIGDDKSMDAWQSQMESAGDDAYDRYKDAQYDN